MNQMYVHEVTPGIYKFISLISFFKTFSTGYFRKQQNETGYFYKMTLVLVSRLMALFTTENNKMELFTSTYIMTLVPMF